MNLFDRLRSRTSQKNRIKGQITTTLGTICTVVLGLGLIVNPFGIAALSVGAVLFGSHAVNCALKTKR